ncbi:hypothetical protein R6Q59_010201 [Mikania micrantha]
MSGQHSLQGACSCGRYTYVVVIPEEQRSQAQVHFRTDDEHRRSQAALLTAFLRVPLAWYSSNTISYFSDETHHSISRTFSPLDEPHSQRKFCGYCGTHLSYWTEEPHEEQDYINVTLGSFSTRDLNTLQELELLPEDIDVQRPHGDIEVAMGGDGAVDASIPQPRNMTRSVRHGTDGPMTWFEEMLDGSHLGRTRMTRRGMGTSADGTTQVSWEVTEYGNENEDVVMASLSSGSKRKLGDTVDSDKTDDRRAGLNAFLNFLGRTDGKLSILITYGNGSS